jgi:hypothetical protein
MIKIAFKLDPTGRLYKTDEYYSNGHWLVRRKYAQLNKAIAKALAPLAPLANGGYANGYKFERTVESTPDMDRVIPSRDGYVKAHLSGRATIRLEAGSVEAVELIPDEFNSGGEAADIDPVYAPLLLLGTPHVRKQNEPVIVIANDDTIAAVIMPRRR